jgi:hypothetical protein
MMTGVGEGDGVGVGEADGVAEGEGEGVGTGAGVGVGDAVGPGVGVGLEVALLPVLAALEELPPPQPTTPNNMHPSTAMPTYLNIRAALLRVRDLDFGNLRCSRVPAGCLAPESPDFQASSEDRQVRRLQAGTRPGVHRPMHHFATHPWLLTACVALGLEAERKC